MLMLCLRANAAGMSDYTFKIDGTHSVFGMNGFDIMVGRTGGSLYSEFCRDQSVSGPLREIYWDEEFVFLKHAGRKERNSFSGDTFLEANDATNVYYVIRRHSDAIAGPFDLPAFSNHLAGVGHPSSIPWKPLPQARKESLMRYPVQSGVWFRMMLGMLQFPSVLLGCLVCYAILSGPVVISLLIVRKVWRKKWDIRKWWKRGLRGSFWLAIAVAVAWAVIYAYT